jgi:hypothetical protein
MGEGKVKEELPGKDKAKRKAAKKAVVDIDLIKAGIHGGVFSKGEGRSSSGFSDIMRCPAELTQRSPCP